MKKPELQKLSPEKLIKLSEENTSDFRWSRSDIYRTAFEIYKKQGKNKELEDMRKEILIFDLSTHNSPKQRFDCMMSGTTDKGEEWKYPNLEKDFSKESIDYYKKRAKITNNPVLKARYSDVIWELKKEVEYARLAVKAYLDCCPIYLTNEWDKELSDSLGRALSIASMTNDKNVINKSLETHYEFIKQLVEKKRFRYLIEIIESILRQMKILKGRIDYKYLVSVIESAISDYAKNMPDSFHLQRSFMELIVKIWKIQKNEEECKKARVRIAESFIEEAEWKKVNYPASNMVAAHFYELAMREYINIGGFDDKVKDLKIKITEANKKAQEGEFKRIETKVEIPKKAIDDYLKRYRDKNALEILQIMGIDKSLIPSYKNAKKTAIENSKKFVVQRLVPVSLMKGNICIKQISKENEKLEFNTIKNFQMGYQLMANMLLSKVFNLLKKKHPTYIDSLIQHLSSSEIINDERMEIIKHGIKAYKEEDHISAIHILVFQIEGILRDLLGKIGLPTFSYRTNEMRERILSDILTTLSQVKGIDKDFLKFIEVFLCDIRGDNYRNDIAHGLLAITAFTKEKVQLLLLILIKLALYKIIKKSRK